MSATPSENEEIGQDLKVVRERVVGIVSQLCIDDSPCDRYTFGGSSGAGGSDI
jgi:hypothetical protein